MVTVLYKQRHGYDVRIYTDDHPPPHAHVWKGKKNLKISLVTFKVTLNRGFNTREIGQIRNLVMEHQDLLLQVWYTIHE